MSETKIPLRDPAKAAFLAWLIPGLGHFYQGRTAKGWLYAVCILGLYFTGFVLGEGKLVYWRWVSPLNTERFMLHYIGQFFVGLPALPALLQSIVHHFAPDSNFLWGFMAEPSQNVINGLLLRLGKLYDASMIYTTAAGLLNVLAIYDAYEGPAYGVGDETDAETQAETGTTEAVKAGGAA